MLKFYRKSRQFGCFNLISGLKDCLEKKAVTTFDYGRWVQSGLTVFHWQSLGKKNTVQKANAATKSLRFVSILFFW